MNTVEFRKFLACAEQIGFVEFASQYQPHTDSPVNWIPEIPNELERRLAIDYVNLGFDLIHKKHTAVSVIGYERFNRALTASSNGIISDDLEECFEAWMDLVNLSLRNYEDTIAHIRERYESRTGEIVQKVQLSIATFLANKWQHQART